LQVDHVVVFGTEADVAQAKSDQTDLS